VVGRGRSFVDAVVAFGFLEQPLEVGDRVPVLVRDDRVGSNVQVHRYHRPLAVTTGNVVPGGPGSLSDADESCSHSGASAVRTRPSRSTSATPDIGTSSFMFMVVIQLSLVMALT
jgi:hypothetical protein